MSAYDPAKFAASCERREAEAEDLRARLLTHARGFGVTLTERGALRLTPSAAQSVLDKLAAVEAERDALRAELVDLAHQVDDRHPNISRALAAHVLQREGVQTQAEDYAREAGES